MVVTMNFGARARLPPSRHHGNIIILPSARVVFAPLHPGLLLHRIGLSSVVTAAKHQRKEFSQDEFDSDVEEDDSMILLLQLVRSFFRKASLRATRAAKGMLPPFFSSDLIAFFVNGAMLLTLLWVAKALLEVISSVGTVVFLAILVVRSIWALLVFLQIRKSEENSWERNGAGSGYKVSPS